jgi:hypothetical protein
VQTSLESPPESSTTGPLISMLADAMGEHPETVSAAAAVTAIRSTKYHGRVETIRKRYAETLKQSGDHTLAKKAVDPLKKRLPAVQWSGTFTGRGDKALSEYSGLICADLDGLDAAQAAEARAKLKDDPHVFALFTSPTGTGLKVVFSVANDAAKHHNNFLAVKAHVAEACGLAVDESCKNVERLCFVSHDPEAQLNPAAMPLPPIEAPAPAPQPAPRRNGDAHGISVELRRKVAADLLGCIDWKTETEGFCECPQWQAHTTETKPEDTRVTLDAVPTVHCFHNSCRSVIEAVNQELRRNIGEAEPAAERKAALRSRLVERLFNIHAKPDAPAPRYFIGQTPICTAGNLTTISAPPKTAKTSLVCAMVASTMTNDPEHADCLGVRSSNPEGHAVVHLDTEQCPADHYSIVERATRRARLTEPPPSLLSYCITGFTIPEARQCIPIVLEDAAATFGGIHSLMLDGVADLVPDVNDAEESNFFVNELHSLAIRYAAPIIGIIHLNPGTEKTRGHLGSQLERKAETNLRLERDGDAIILWGEKNRRAPILKANGPRFVWSGELMMHVSVQNAGDAKAESEHGLLLLEAEAVFTRAGKQSLHWGDFNALLARECNLTSSGARKRMEKMVRARVITRDVLKFYTLTQ